MKKLAAILTFPFWFIPFFVLSILLLMLVCYCGLRKTVVYNKGVKIE